MRATCPKCQHRFEILNPISQKGGKAKVPKGFASPAVLAKALATRAKNRRNT